MNTATTQFEGQERSRGACVSCHRRKVKCVRSGESCSSCLQNNIPCRYTLARSSDAVTARDHHEQPLRKRRGPYRKGKTPREKELEAIVTSLTARCLTLERRTHSSTATGIGSPCARSRSNSSGNAVATPRFLEAFSVDSQQAQLVTSPNSSQNGAPAPTNSSPSRLALDSLQSSPSAYGSSLQLSQDQIFHLWHIYMIRVEPLTKLIPPSSFADLLLIVQGEYGSKHDVRMLTTSICIAAINALSKAEVFLLYNESKDIVSARFMSVMEATLAQSVAPQKPSTRLLQAFVLNAVSLFRHNDAGEATFTKTFELALDVLHRLGTEPMDTARCSPYDREIRSRCWWTLRKLNNHCIHNFDSEAEGLEFTSDVPLPLNINDIDLTPAMDEMPTARSSSTDMSFFLDNLKVIQLTAALKRLGSTYHASENDISIRLRRRRMVESAVADIESNFLRHCDTSRPLDWFLMLTTKAMLNPIEIMMLDEGLEQNSCSGAVSQDSKEDQKFLLRLDVVECWHLLRTNENLKSWRWFLDTLPQAFTVGDLQADLLKRPGSTYSSRAYELINLISHA